LTDYRAAGAAGTPPKTAGGQKFIGGDDTQTPFSFCPPALPVSRTSHRFLEKKKGKCPCPSPPVRGHLKLNSLKFSLHYQNNFVS